MDIWYILILPYLPFWNGKWERKTRNPSYSCFWKPNLFVIKEGSVWLVLAIHWAEAYMSQKKAARPSLTRNGSQQQNVMSLTQTPPLLRRLPPPLTALANHNHWHFRGQCRGSKVVRISPNQLSSHSSHTTHCPWTRTYPRLRLGEGVTLEGMANILKWNTNCPSNYIGTKYTFLTTRFRSHVNLWRKVKFPASWRKQTRCCFLPGHKKNLTKWILVDPFPGKPAVIDFSKIRSTVASN